MLFPVNYRLEQTDQLSSVRLIGSKKAWLGLLI